MAIPISPDLSPTDMSAIAFSKIFGENWWAITEHASVNTPFFKILSEINTLLMAAVVGWSIWTFVMSLGGTAQEGTVGGRRFNGVWWPIRCMFGMTMTTPMLSGGISLFQAGILVCLGWACTWANSIYYFSMDHLAKSNFAAVTAEMPPQMQEEAKNIARVLMQAGLVQNYISKESIDENREFLKRGSQPISPVWVGFLPFSTSAHSSTLESNDFSLFSNDRPKWIFKFAVPPGRGLDSEDLGTIEIPGDVKDPMMLAKVNGIIAMNNVIFPAASRIVYGVEQTDSNWLISAVNAYQSSVMPVIQNFASYYPQYQITQDSQKFVGKTKELGWMAAGAWPLMMSQLSREARDIVASPVNLSRMDTKAVSRQAEDFLFGGLGIALSVGDAKFNAQPDPSQVGTSIKQAMLAGDVSSMVEDALYAFSGRFFLQDLLNRFENEDPTLVVAQFGHRIMDASAMLWSAGLGLRMASGYGEGFTESLFGKVVGVFTGGQLEGAAGAGIEGAKYIAESVVKITDGLYTIGIIFAYVIPLMPMLYWCIAMVGFLLLVVEVMVAAPFWVAAHAWSTQADGLAGEMGSQGYYQFLEILFKPPLYVAGFIIIFMIMRVMGWIVARIFEAFYYSYSNADISSVSSHTGILTSFFMCIIMSVLFVYMFSFLCSQGYSHLPRKVMSWIGHQASTMGLAGHADSMRQIIMGGVGNVTHSSPKPSSKPQRGDNQGKKGGGESSGGSSGYNPNRPGEVSEVVEGTGGAGSNLLDRD
ncbi:DotA/TraY family protein [Pseudodesulfovibrio piezophilus]|nr:DotA/TraY family protein [Pseudodesulfovibrio piezophilus]